MELRNRKTGLWFLWLSLICVVVFVLQNLISGFTELMLLNTHVFSGELWRFVTSLFLHADIIHLIYNLFALLLFGFILERIIGSRNFLIVFFASGIIGNLISVNFYESSLGASGAIYGVIGCVAVLNPMMMIWAFGMLMPMFIAAILWIAGDILGVFGVFDKNVGYIAHLGGVFIGVVLGIIFRFRYIKRKVKEERIRFDETSVRDWEDRWMR
jgi:membrane associated rhomboid family serine protease